ncbi:MAG: hypothetical protein FJ020_07025 [Chloroflexi bacterium]|nr:hypothetical protein [Chloroflexota bacterium]
MKIECLICLKETAIPNNLNTQKYDGQITCRECGSLLQLKLVKSKVEQCKIVRVGHPGVTPQGPALASSTRPSPDIRKPRQ